MIKLTKLDGRTFVLNSDLIEYMESTPDTVITITSGKKYIVTNTVDEVIEKIVKYRKEIYSFYFEK
ncbi:MAG: flagellar FlbD family protein [Clostridia bacterium]|nr:flagellar FlbD family protein [Clostridia bacterium]